MIDFGAWDSQQYKSPWDLYHPRAFFCGAGNGFPGGLYTQLAGVRFPSAARDYITTGDAVNKLKPEIQEAAIKSLVEGCSIRSTERMTGVHRDTIMRLLVSFGTTCETILDEKMRNLTCKRFEVDEIWAYVGKKQRHVQANNIPQEVEDFYTFVAIDAEALGTRTYACSEDRN